MRRTSDQKELLLLSALIWTDFHSAKLKLSEPIGIVGILYVVDFHNLHIFLRKSYGWY